MLRFHLLLGALDVRLSRIRLSMKASRVRPTGAPFAIPETFQAQLMREIASQERPAADPIAISGRSALAGCVNRDQIRRAVQKRFRSLDWRICNPQSGCPNDSESSYLRNASQPAYTHAYTEPPTQPGKDGEDLRQLAAELARVVAVWPSLAPEVRSAILRLADTASTSDLGGSRS